MLAAKDKVSELVPQCSPMLMVDTLIYHDKQKTQTGFRVENDNLFIINGYFSEEGLIENIAQSAALRTGWMALQESQDNGPFIPPLGVIGSVKNFKLYCLPPVNTEIITEIIVQAEIFNATLITGKVMLSDEVLAEGELKIFLQDLRS